MTSIMTSSLSAQIASGDYTMSEGVNEALFFELKGADKKKAEGIWKSYIKSFGKVETNRKSKEIILKEAVIPAINVDGQLMLFTKFEEFDAMTRVYVWFKAGDTFLTESNDRSVLEGTDVFLKEYMFQVEKDVIKDELNNEEKVLGNLQKDLDKLEKKNRGYHDDIEKAKEAIRKAESEIERNLQDQSNKKLEIENQRKKVSAVSDKMNRVGKNGS